MANLTAAQRAWSLPEISLSIMSYTTCQEDAFWLAFNLHTLAAVVRDTWREIGWCAYHGAAVTARDQRIDVYCRAVRFLDLTGSMACPIPNSHADVIELFKTFPKLQRATWATGVIERRADGSYCVDSVFNVFPWYDQKPSDFPTQPQWGWANAEADVQHSVRIRWTSLRESLEREARQELLRRGLRVVLEDNLWRLYLDSWRLMEADDLDVVVDMLKERERKGRKPIPELYLKTQVTDSATLLDPIRRLRQLRTSVHVDLNLDGRRPLIAPPGPPLWESAALVASWSADFSHAISGHLSDIRAPHRGPHTILPKGLLKTLNIRIAFIERREAHPLLAPIEGASVEEQIQTAVQPVINAAMEMAWSGCEVVIGNMLAMETDANRDDLKLSESATDHIFDTANSAVVLGLQHSGAGRVRAPTRPHSRICSD